MNDKRIHLPSQIKFVGAFVGVGKKPITTLWEHPQGNGERGRESIDLSIQEATQLASQLVTALGHFK